MDFRLGPKSDAFREEVRAFVADNVDDELFERAAATGTMHDWAVHHALGSRGWIAAGWPVEYGGQGRDPYEMTALKDELRLAGVPQDGIGNTMIVANTLRHDGTEEQKRKFLPPALAGEYIFALGYSEPDSGSDVAAAKTRATRDGDEWVINGSKLYITNGAQADWICLLARTSGESGHRGMSQIVVETDRPGFRVSRTLDKLGNRSSDTAELSFADVRVPVSHTIGEIGRGFQQQMEQFQAERMIAAYLQVGAMQKALERTREYLARRRVFGRPLLANDHIAYRLAELSAQLDLVRHYNYACAEAYLRGEDTTRFATVAKLAVGRLAREIADTCLQFHGGTGYMEETWTARFYRDSRLISIGGGADEVMLSVLARLDGFTA